MVARRVAAGLVASVLTLAAGAVNSAGVAAPADLSGSFVGPVVLSDLDGTAQQLSVAATDVFDGPQRGMAVASWRAFDGVNWRIAVTTDVGGGNWTAPVLISPPGVDAERPSAGIALSEDAADHLTFGTYEQVAWRLATGEIQVAWKTDHMAAWASPVTVSAPGAETVAPLSAVTYDLDPLYTFSAVGWLARDKSHWRVHYLEFDPGTRPDPARVRLVSPAGEDAADLSLSAAPRANDLAWVVQVDGHWQPQWWDSYYPHTRGAALTPAEDATSPQANWYGILWTSTFEGHVRLRASLHGIDYPGGPLKPPVTVSGVGVDVSDVNLVSFDVDRVQVAWLENDGSSTRVATAWGNPANNRWHPVTYLSPTQVEAAELSVSPDNGVAWTETAAGQPSQVKLARWDLSGWSTPITVASGDSAATDPRPVFTEWGPTVTFGAVWVQPTAHGSVVEVTGFDATAPQTAARVAGEGWQGSTVRLSWAAMDDWSLVPTTQVRTKSASATDGSWTTGVQTFSEAAGTEEVPLEQGTSYCFDVRGIDAIGHTEAWHGYGFLSGDMCTCTPTDDRRLARSPGWLRVHGDAYIGGSALRATTRGSAVSLRLVRSTGQKVRLQKGPHGGKVRIAFGDEHRTLSLKAPIRRMVWILAFPIPIGVSPRTTELTVTVISNGRPVLIDAILSRRY